MPTLPDAIYTPGPKHPATDESLDHIAGVLDDMFRIPGTRIRFGLDAIVGWIPGIGDAFAGIASFIIVFAAWQRGAPGITLARMVLNVLLEMLVGAVPVVGDLFHVAWKCNRRNYKLLMRVRHAPRAPTARDWLVVVLIVIAIAAAVVAPIALLVWIFHWQH
ncbi:MAG: hypothetical protein QOD84_1070 [Acidobacteriaceae bacterium]